MKSSKISIILLSIFGALSFITSASAATINVYCSGSGSDSWCEGSLSVSNGSNQTLRLQTANLNNLIIQGLPQQLAAGQKTLSPAEVGMKGGSSGSGIIIADLVQDEKIIGSCSYRLGFNPSMNALSPGVQIFTVDVTSCSGGNLNASVDAVSENTAQITIKN